MSITYTFPSDCPIQQLRGVTATGGVLCRLDGRWMDGDPDAVRFDIRVDGKAVVARIAGKPELEAELAAHLAAKEAKAQTLAAIGWPAYQAVQRRAANAAHAYERASEYGYPAAEAEADRKAYADLEAARVQYPQAALYARAENYSMASHDVKSGAGRRAMAAIEGGADPAAAVQEMENEWTTYCDAQAAAGV